MMRNSQFEFAWKGDVWFDDFSMILRVNRIQRNRRVILPHVNQKDSGTTNTEASYAAKCKFDLVKQVLLLFALNMSNKDLKNKKHSWKK